MKIDLIVRGICGLNPFALERSAAKNIRIVAILDRYLEHSRIYIFNNNGAPEYFVGSADLMPRNLKRRVELLFPVEQVELRQELDFIVNAALNDRRKGRTLCGGNAYTKTCTGGAARFEDTRSQVLLYEYYKNRLAKERRRSAAAKKKLQVFSAEPDSTKR